MLTAGIYDASTKANLTPEEYVYTCLVKGGMSKYDAFMVAFNPKDDNPNMVRDATNALEMKSAISKIFRNLQDNRDKEEQYEAKIKTLNRKLRQANKKLRELDEYVEKDTELDDEEKEKKLESISNSVDITKNKDSLLQELNYMQSVETDQNMKLKIIAKIADIQKMKDQEEKLDEDVVHYYLPITCKDCSLYKNQKKGK